MPVPPLRRLRWTGQRPWYEDLYVKLNLPRRATSAWFRYTVLAPVDGEPRVAVWSILDLDGRHVANRGETTIDAFRFDDDPFTLATPHGQLTSTSCSGSADGVEWDLEWPPAEYAFHHVPQWMYPLPLPRSKVWTPQPDLRATGHIELDGTRLELDGCPGSLGHVWGPARTTEWGWAHCNVGDGVTWEALTARAPVVAGVEFPTTVVLVRHADRTLAFRGPFATTGEYGPDGYRFSGVGLRYRIEGRVHPTSVACVTYPNPDGSRTYCHNTKRADSELVLHERRGLGWREIGRWTSEGTTAFEVGAGRSWDGVPVVL